MKKRVYVTGIAGLLGNWVARKYINKNWEVWGCDNFIGGLRDNVPHSDYAHVDEIDILDIDSLKKSMKGSDIVVHCAALPYEGLSVFSPKLVTENIVGGTVSVASAAIHNNVELFVNCSSMARYGAQEPPFTEDMPRKPEDPYGLAKVHAEEHLELLNKLHGLKYITIVPHNVIGIGQRYMDPFRNVVAIMINRIKLGKKIVIYGDGEQKRSFSNIDDCITAIEKIIDSDRDLCGQVYNIGPDDNEITIKELAYKVGHHCDVYPHFEHYPDRPGEVKYAWCSSKKIKEEFNYNITKTLDDTIIEMCSWINKRGPQEFEYTLNLEFEKENTPETWKKKLI